MHLIMQLTRSTLTKEPSKRFKRTRKSPAMTLHLTMTRKSPLNRFGPTVNPRKTILKSKANSPKESRKLYPRPITNSVSNHQILPMILCNLVCSKHIELCAGEMTRAKLEIETFVNWGEDGTINISSLMSLKDEALK